MSDIQEALKTWSEQLDDAQKQYLEHAATALAVHFEPTHPATEAARVAYDRMMRVMLGEGLKLPKGYHVVDKDRVPYAEESD